MSTKGPGDQRSAEESSSAIPRFGAVPEGAARLGRYTLLQRLDVGGMAEIFLARQDGVAGFKKTVVIKRILPQLAADSRFIEMFLAEANVVAMLHHQNIVQILELGELDGTYFIALEYVDGMTLHRLAVRSWRHKRAVPMELICAAFADAALGLHHAHTAKGPDGNPLGIVHRDITPDNMMIDREGVTKILDFGIAKPTNDGERPKTQVGEMKGKLPFVPPEQLIGDDPDARADIYTLGVGLYWMLTGRRPINGNHDLELMNRIMKDQPVAPSTHNALVPKALDDLVLQMLEKDRRLRPQTAEEVHDALAFALSSRRKVGGPFVNQIMALPRQEEDDRMPASMEGLQASKPATQTFKTLTDTGAIILPGASSDMDIDFTGEGDSEPELLDGGAELIDESGENATVALSRDDLMAIVKASQPKAVPAEVLLAESPTIEVSAAVVPSPFETGATATFAPPTEPTGAVEVQDAGGSADAMENVLPMSPAPRALPRWAAAAGVVAVIAVVVAVMVVGGDDPPSVPEPIGATEPPVVPVEGPPVVPVEVKPIEVKPVDVVPVEPVVPVVPVEVKPGDPIDPAPAEVETRPMTVKAPTTVRWWLAGKLLVMNGGKLLVPVTAKSIVAIDDKRGVRTIVAVPASGEIDYAKLPRGKLLVRANPYADVFLAKDGLGTTPFPALDVVAGTYTVRLVHEKREEKRTIEVKAGAEARVIVDFTK